jgi:UDP:flavonoid glycosyltransferase YjiC (YdhE family)
MDEALEKNIPVIYISLGTMVKWQDWYVEVFYEGLKRIKCRVIWCLRGKEFHHSDNPDFKVGPWWP